MGALSGLLGIELAGQGPGPFCAAWLADHGADIVRVVAPSRGDLPGLAGAAEPMVGGRPTLELDLKSDGDRERLLELVDGADFLLEGFRPGVVERLGIGPDVCCTRNPRLVYARITGWGQEGPLAARAGHDIDYIALTGALAAIGPPEQPVPPLNLIGDYAGGGLFAALGILAALVERQRSGEGQVVDAAMVDGAGYLMAPFFELAAGNAWTSQRAGNILDGGAPFYGVYTTADGGHLAVGALEPQFFAELCRVLDVGDDPAFADQYDTDRWPAMRARLVELFASRTRSAWQEVFAEIDACVAPVLTMDEAPSHAHHRARGGHVELPSGVVVPEAAPRLSRTPGERASTTSQATDELLARFRERA